MANKASAAEDPGPPPADRLARLVRGCVILLLSAVVIFSRTIAVPALAAVLLSIALFPLVNRAARLGLPRPLASFAALAGLVSVSSGILYAVREPLLQLAARGPELVSAGRLMLTSLAGEKPVPVVPASEALVQEVVAKQGEQAALVDLLAPLAAGLTGSLVAVGTSLILCHFILTCGTGVGRAMLSAVRARPGRRAWLRVCGSIRTQAAHYLQLVTAINVVFGIVTGLALTLLGVEGAAAYGVIAGLMNFIPIVGALVTTCVLLAGGVAEHGIAATVMVPAAVFMLLHIVESQFVTPTLLGKRLLINPLIVIAGVLVGAAAWGVGGAFLAVPILTATKIALDAHPRARRWGQVLGRGALADCRMEEARRVRLRRATVARKG